MDGDLAERPDRGLSADRSQMEGVSVEEGGGGVEGWYRAKGEDRERVRSMRDRRAETKKPRG